MSSALVLAALEGDLTGKGRRSQGWGFWTLSAWEDEAALLGFVRASPHVEIMTTLAPYMGKTSFVRWKVKGSELPLDWDEALKRAQ